MWNNRCEYIGCDLAAKSRGLCNTHYMRWWKSEDFSPITKEERFWRLVGKGDDCWSWLGATSLGYGIFQKKKAHRVSYELSVGEIPEGLVLDHLCRNTICVRPDHLEPVTIGENVLRGFNPPAENARKTHCHRGHELLPDNVSIIQGWRRCKACARQRQAEYVARKEVLHGLAV
jgi:HNH endonuclease